MTMIGTGLSLSILWLIPTILLGIGVVILCYFIGMGNTGLFWYLIFLLIAMLMIPKGPNQSVFNIDMK